MRLLNNSLWLALILVLCGCSMWGNYPPIEGAAGISKPSLAPFPTLMAEGIRYAWQQDGGEGKITFNLPPDTPAKVYDKVAARLGAGEPLRQPDPGAYHVLEVRIRTVDAYVDVIHPGSGGVPKLMTITFKQNLIKGWRIVEHRDWGGRVEEVPAPGYVPPAEVGLEVPGAPEDEGPQRPAEPTMKLEAAGG